MRAVLVLLLVTSITSSIEADACLIPAEVHTSPTDGLKQLPRNIYIGPVLGKCPTQLVSSTGQQIEVIEASVDDALSMIYCRPAEQLSSSEMYYFNLGDYAIGFTVEDEDDTEPPSLGMVEATRKPQRLNPPFVSSSCDWVPPTVELLVSGITDNAIYPGLVKFLVCDTDYCFGPYNSEHEDGEHRIVELRTQIKAEVESIKVYPVDLSLNIGDPIEVEIENEIGCSCRSNSNFISDSYFLVLLMVLFKLRRARNRSNGAF